MYRYALSIIGGLFIGWNICLAATNSDLHSRNAEGGGILPISGPESTGGMTPITAEG